MRERTLRPRLLAVVVVALSALSALAGTARAQFGIASLSASLSTPQAGAHADYSTAFELNTDALGNPAAQLKAIKVALPPGLVGNTQAIERCAAKTFAQLDCGAGAQVGTLYGSFITCRGVSTPLTAPAQAGDTTITVASTGEFCGGEPEDTITIGSGAEAETAKIAYVQDATTLTLDAPLERAHPAREDVAHVANAFPIPISLFNLEPTKGHVATFGASLLFASMVVQVDASSDGRLTATIEDVSTLLPMRASTLTLWGVPADPSHDPLRCTQFLSCPGGPSPAAPVPLMTNPTDCSGPPPASELSVTSWRGESVTGVASLPSITGCEALKLASTLTVTPGSTQRDEPSQYEIDLRTPQYSEPYGIATAAVRSASFTFPAGASLSPSLANGLQGCSAGQAEEGGCPNPSKVGTAEIVSPVLQEPLRGGVFIGSPTPSERYPLIVSVGSGSANLVLHGQVEPDEGTGQLTVNFKAVPQLPFSDFKLNLFGGPSAPVANPLACGPATSTAHISSYGSIADDPSSTFTVDSNGAGGACPSSPPFAPGFSAGTTDPLAGGFSPFSLTVSREDGQQDISSFTAQLPAGLVGLLQSVPPCAEPQAAEGACTAASQVGTATIAAGAGPLPLYVSGPVYLTGPYDGAPFGLAVVIDAVAGPFDLGRLNVRSRILIDPADLRLTVASDPFPQILSGIPLRLRTVNIVLNRPGFILNPTDCARQTVTATVYAVQGAQAPVSTPFQIAGCTGLHFTPRLTASTLARASLQGDGASLSLTVSNPGGSSAAIQSLHVQLPAQLRPRLTTIQHACLQSAGSAAPSTCPQNAVVGHATALSPLTGTPLTGAIYLIAHGGTALPSLVMQLHGGGIVVNLEGALSISRAGTISAAFRNLPDVPIASLHLELSRGRFSMLGAIQGLCASKLNMPYTMTAQNGAQVAHTVRVAVEGCAKPKPKPKPNKHAAKRGGASSRRR